MRYLVLSDIHSNLESLQAVFVSADEDYDQAVCCGDVIDYGADPNAVTEFVSAHIPIIVRGNHDKACAGLDDSNRFNYVTRSAALWTQNELTPINSAYIRGLPHGPLIRNEFTVVHGSPLSEDEYLLTMSDAGRVFNDLTTNLTFFGHTHVQGGFVKELDRVTVIEKTPFECDHWSMRIEPSRNYLINPGSVGQPRDGDPRASYVIYDSGDRLITFHRVSYDVEETQRKIRLTGLPTVLSDCLARGKW